MASAFQTFLTNSPQMKCRPQTRLLSEAAGPEVNLVISRQLLLGTDGLPCLPLLLGLEVLEVQPSLRLWPKR